MNLFYHISTDSYSPISYGSNYLYEQFDLINNFIKRNFDIEYHQLLAKPFHSGKEINWYSNLNGEIKPIKDFSDSDKNELLIKYNAFIHDINSKCAEFKSSGNLQKNEWASTLSEVFNLENNFVFSNGIEIVIIWGWKFFNKNENYIPFDEYKSSIKPTQKSEEEKTPLEEAEKKEVPITEPKNEVVEIENEEIINTPEEESDPPIIPIKKKRNWFFLFLDFIENFLRNYWWLLLILLAILLLLWWFKDSSFYTGISNPENNSVVNVEERLSEILPVHPRIRFPIDTTKFIDGGDSVSVVISDLINIALKNKKQNFKIFAIDLKKNFPDSTYKIVYYDDETSRLQLQFPEDLRSTIKEEIRKKLPDYDLLIWEESIFETNRTFNDPSFTDASKDWYFDAINAKQAWDITTGDTSVVIAIVDNGFDLNQIELKKRIVYPFNIFLHNKQIYGNATISHGTHVAGIALANNDNGYGTSGIAPKCSFMPVQIGGDGEYFTNTDVIDGVLYSIKNGADVINLSLGKILSKRLSSLQPPLLEAIINSYSKDEEYFWDELFQYADKENVTIVLAAGNQNLLIGLDPMQRSNDVIIVTAVNENLRKASFSNYGKMSLISAPGVNIYNCIPDGKFDFYDGTSMAAPMVTGAVALMKSLNPKLSNREIIKILKETAYELPEISIGPLIQIDKALFMVMNEK